MSVGQVKSMLDKYCLGAGEFQESVKDAFWHLRCVTIWGQVCLISNYKIWNFIKVDNMKKDVKSLTFDKVVY